MRKRDLEPSIFLSRVTTLRVSDRTEHRSFIQENLINIPPPVTFEKIWSRLTIYWDFMNYGLLEHVINKLGSEDLKHQMQDYVEELSTFKSSTRLCDFIDSWPCKDNRPSEDELKKIVIKMNHEWTKCTLQDVESFRTALIHKFFLPEFDLILQNANRGCVCVTWLTSPSTATLLQQNLANIETEFFTEHKIETVMIDRQDCYPTLISGYPTEQDTSEQPAVGISPPMQAKKFHLALQQHTNEKLVDSGTGAVKYISIGELAAGDPQLISSTSGYQRKLHGESYASKTALTSFTSPRGLVAPTTTEEYVKQKGVDEVPRLAKLLPSVERYLSKAEVEADPSLPTKYRDYLSSTPAIRAAMDTPFNALSSAEVFTWSQLTESPPPTTMTELFTTFTLNTLVGYLSLYHKPQLKVTSFSDLPPDVYKQFLGLCRMAYEGILNRQQLVFSAANLPTGFSPLSLMQEIPPVYTQGKASSYHFTHLTFLSAIHISQLPTDEQTKQIQDHVDSWHFKMTLRFVAGLTKLANVPPEITRKLREDHDNNLTLLHWLFECKDTSVTIRTLGSDEMVVTSHYSWTPLDHYVTGHVISHSNFPWRLNFIFSSIDDENFELFCQGCATGGTGCEGYVSSADFSYNDIISKYVQSFVSIPPHILLGMRVLDLSGNKLDGRACDLLATVVPSMSRLEVLWLSDNPIGSGGAVGVIQSLCGSGVKQLLLHNTGIGRPDCEALSELLQSTHSLEWLYINQNNLSSESVATIIAGLSHNNSLRSLNISGSHFSMQNTHHLSLLLREHSKCTLTSLELQDCHISSEKVQWNWQQQILHSENWT